MEPRHARALLVIAVFALLAAVTAASHYLADTAHGVLPPPPLQKPLAAIFWSGFRYYLAWAICAPLVFWLARKVPIGRGRSYWSVAFHLLMPILATVPFLVFRLLLNGALTGTAPEFSRIAAMWRQILPLQALGTFPVYWLLLAAGLALQVQRDVKAREVQAVQLERSLADAQLDGLRMKLQPHFLFNTLNAIGSLAQQGDTDDVVRMVEHLGTLLRLSMETSGRQLVTLDEELRLLDAYLAIEEVRHKERLVVRWRVDPGTGPALVPSLILQPLVENAIAHGLGGRIEPTTIEIVACRNAQSLDVMIRDNGPGLPTGWTLARGAGRGLGNVVERLAAVYGDRARLEVGPERSGWTISSLHLPFAAAPSPLPLAVERGSQLQAT